MGFLRPFQGRQLLEKPVCQMQYRGRLCGFHPLRAQRRGLPQPAWPAAGLSQAYRPTGMAVKPLLSRRKHRLPAYAHRMQPTQPCEVRSLPVPDGTRVQGATVQEGPRRAPPDFLLARQDNSLPAMVDVQKSKPRVPCHLHLPRALPQQHPVFGALTGIPQAILRPSLDTAIRRLMQR